MSIPVLVFGASGTGKSYAMRDLDTERTAYINVLGKPLPFQSDMQTAASRDLLTVGKWLDASSAPIAVVDDFGYCITDIYMRYSYGEERMKDQYEVYKIIGARVYNFMNNLNTDGRDDRIVYIVMHDDIDSSGHMVPATVGKMLNEKINLLGMFSLVLTSGTDGERYWFNTHRAPAKTPPGMFDEDEIENDMEKVDRSIRYYYDIDG